MDDVRAVRRSRPITETGRTNCEKIATAGMAECATTSVRTVSIAPAWTSAASSSSVSIPFTARRIPGRITSVTSSLPYEPGAGAGPAGASSMTPSASSNSIVRTGPVYFLRAPANHAIPMTMNSAALTNGE